MKERRVREEDSPGGRDRVAPRDENGRTEERKDRRKKHEGRKE
jgi:hypothetical protein